MLKKIMKIARVAGRTAGVCALGALTGCMHGATWDEYKLQLLESDPWGVEEVEPNDTQVAESNLEFIRKLQTERDARENFKRELRVLPSQNVTAFLNTPRAGGAEANRQLLVAFSGQLTSALSRVWDFKVIGTENELMAQLSMPSVNLAPPAGNTAYVLSFNILSLTTRYIPPPQTAVDPYAGRRQRKHKHAEAVALGAALGGMVTGANTFEGEIDATVALLDPKGDQVMSFTSKCRTQGKATAELAEQALIRQAVEDLVGQYTAKVSPPAYVSRLRGNGLFAEVTLGSEFGLKPGMQVDFYLNKHAKSLATGEAVVTKTVVATGRVASVRFIDEKTAWVKIDDHHFRKVRLGTLVRVSGTEKNGKRR